MKLIEFHVSNGSNGNSMNTLTAHHSSIHGEMKIKLYVLSKKFIKRRDFMLDPNNKNVDWPQVDGESHCGLMLAQQHSNQKFSFIIAKTDDDKGKVEIWKEFPISLVKETTIVTKR